MQHQSLFLKQGGKLRLRDVNYERAKMTKVYGILSITILTHLIIYFYS